LYLFGAHGGFRERRDAILRVGLRFFASLHRRGCLRLHWLLSRFWLGHIDDLSDPTFALASRRRFFSQQLGGDPQGFYFLFDSRYFLFFASEYFKGIFHGGGLLGHDQHQPINPAPTLNHNCGSRNITKVHNRFS
jgi:hypothetical protein